jgi:group I intron endonuclease
MNGIIYRIFNIKTGKSYIGKTYATLYQRLQEHIRDKDRYPNRPIYRALNKYGIESFSAEILGEYPEQTLEDMEIEFIQFYKSYGKSGYNATLGGDGRRRINIDTDLLISKYRELKTVSATATHFGIDVDTCKKLLSNNIDTSLFDIKSDRRNRLSTKVLVIDTQMEFNNPYECAKFLIDCDIIDNSISERNAGISIARACKHPSKTYKGLSFSYTN